MPRRGLFDVLLEDCDISPDVRMSQLIVWAARLATLGFTPPYGQGDHGNLSCRTPRGLLITARETRKATLTPRHFVEVLGLQRNHSRFVIRCRGRCLPSTDSLLHWRIYQARPDIKAIFHGHDAMTLRKAGLLGLPISRRSARVPSIGLIDEVRRLAATHNYLLLRDHGFLALAPTSVKAGTLMRLWHERAVQEAR